MSRKIAVFLVLQACTVGEVRTPPLGDTAGAVETGSVDTEGEPGPCPVGMQELETFCIDRYEAHLVDTSPYAVPTGAEVAAVAAGVVPQAHISGIAAAQACENAGKRLCTEDEWLRACQGPEGHVYPYGDVYVAGACNDTYPGGHPLVDYFGTSEGIWDGVHMNDPGINQQEGTVEPGGAHPECVSAEGVYDLHGNLHEWVADESGVFKGGFYADASINGSGCLYRTRAHTTTYHDYSTGFRCCTESSSE